MYLMIVVLFSDVAFTSTVLISLLVPLYGPYLYDILLNKSWH